MTRQHFGQAIGAFQGVEHRLADLATDLELALSLVWYATHACGLIQDRAVRIAMELHGGIGFTWEFDLPLWFRRAMFDRAWLGAARYHRLRAADLAGW